MRTSWFIPLAALCAFGSLPAQEGSPGAQPAQPAPVFTGRALPGRKAGTERWIVHFKTAPYSLDAYQAEVYGRGNADKLDLIVQDIERRMKAGRAGFVQDIEALGGSVVAQWWIVNGAAIEIAPKQLAAVRKLDNVAYLQPDVEVFPLIKTATNAANHNSDALQASGFTGSRVGVAIIDTSFDDNMNNTGRPHVTFSRRGSSTVNRFCHKQKVGLRPFDDPHPHGTGVASIAAGWKWRTATADMGHAFDALYACFSIANSSNGSSSTSNMATAYNAIAAIRLRCRTVSSNLSYSGSSNPLSIEQKAMDNLALRSDVVNCTAAGNSGSNVSFSLANINGLSVAAVNENSHTLASFSSRGFQGGRYFPNIAANGVSTNMARQNNENTDYVASGTSMASPMVCGGAALIRDVNTALKADETIAILLAATQKNSGAGSTIKTLGVGAGYMKLDAARDIARNSARHGRVTLTLRSRTFTRSIPVTRGQRVQCAIKWHRQNVNSTSWSNLDLALLRGSTVLVNSDTRLNTEEFVRFDATATETLTMRVTLMSLGSGQSSQTFGWACNGPGRKPGLYTAFGTGCKGSGVTPGGCTVLPKAYATKFGQTANTFPHARANMRYQQVFLGREIGTGPLTWTELCLRLDERFGGPAETQSIQVFLGQTRLGHTNLTTNFLGNYFVFRVPVFSGNLNLPLHSGGGKLGDFKVCMKFTRPYIWKAVMMNLIVEIINQSRSSKSHFEDFCFGATDCTTTRVYAFSATAKTATSRFTNQGLVMCLRHGGGSGAIPVLGNAGVPEVGRSFTVTLAQAKARALALLWLGSRTAVRLPGGCTLYATNTVLMGANLTSTAGTAARGIFIPNIPALIGVKFANQWWVVDSGGALLGVLALSNGGEGTIGG